jgi:hypothetical protein
MRACSARSDSPQKDRLHGYVALRSFFARGPPPSTLRFPWAEGGAILKCSISYPSGALTDPGASLTLNVLLLYAINVVIAAPCVARSDQKSGACCEEHHCPNAPFNPKCAGAIRRMASAPE